MTLLYRITKSETLRDLKADLTAIRDVGIQIESVTCDGAPNIIKAVREVCPEAILQRCTVHVAREIETWITRKPQTVAAQELLELVHLLNGVQTHDEAQLWIRAFIDWYRRHEPFINEKTVDVESGRWWFGLRIRCCIEVSRISSVPYPICFHIRGTLIYLNLQTLLSRSSVT